MKKEERMIVNGMVEEAWNSAKEHCDHRTGKRLRSCSAWVYDCGDYYFLRSYNTIVAFIDKRTDTCYDVLRLVYGYTATSSQHISKFAKDYGQGKWGCERKIAWYNV